MAVAGMAGWEGAPEGQRREVERRVDAPVRQVVHLLEAGENQGGIRVGWGFGCSRVGANRRAQGGVTVTRAAAFAGACAA